MAKNPEIWVNRGITFLKNENYQNALEDFSHAIELKNDFAEAYFNRANAYSKLNEDEKACLDMKNSARHGYQPAYGHINSLCN